MEQIGKYRVVRLIGAGGMGRVYEAHDPLIDRRVAIKTLSLDILNDAEARSRFFREARAAGQLSHPHLITIFDTGESDGHPYLVMEFLEGEDLSRVIVERQLTLATKLQLMTQMCHGLVYAHDHGVVHRDIKPANIFLTAQGIKILDFGLARGAVSEVTQTGRVLGTPHYMAPEQIRGEGTDVRVDIFSLGVVFYELLSGRKAFEGDSVAATIYKVLEFHPEPLHHWDSTVPPALSAMVERALAKDRAARYQRVDQMLGEITRIQSQLDAQAASRHDTTVVTPVASRAPARRSPTVAWAAAAVLLVVAAATATVFYRRSASPPPAAAIVRNGPPTAPASSSAPAPATTSVSPPTTSAAPPPTPEPPRSAAPSSRQATIDTPSRRSAAAPPTGNASPTLNAQPTAAPSPRVEPPAPAGASPSARRDPPNADRPPAPPEPRPASPSPPDIAGAAPPPAIAPPVVAPSPPAPTTSSPAAPPPSAPATATAAPIENATAAVQETLGRYKAALEARNINALKQVWPGLSGRQEMATRSEFDNARSIAVDLRNVSVQLAGSGTATVTCRRGYVVTTLDNRTLQSTTRMIVTMQRHNNSWVIDAIRHEADR